MICPDCDGVMQKAAIQHEDLSGWIVGWLCDCPYDHEAIKITVHAADDWTTPVLLEAADNAERMDNSNIQNNADMVASMRHQVREDNAMD